MIMYVLNGYKFELAPFILRTLTIINIWISRAVFKIPNAQITRLRGSFLSSLEDIGVIYTYLLRSLWNNSNTYKKYVLDNYKLQKISVMALEAYLVTET